MAEITARPQTTFSRATSLSGLTLLFAVVGSAIAAYLTFVHYQESALVCNIGGGCETVQESRYATIGPIPIALLGVGMFLAVGVLAVARIFRWSFISAETANILTWAITLSGLLYYAYLSYVELFVLDAICQWCVGSSLAAIGIFVSESIMLWRNYSSDGRDVID